MLTDHDKQLLDLANNDVHDDPNDLQEKIDKVMNKAKYKAFGKVKHCTKPKVSEELKFLQKKKFNLLEEDDLSNVEDELAVVDNEIKE